MKKKLLKYGIGVDMGSKKFDVCITSEWDDGHQKIEATKTFDNTASEHKKFHQWVEKHRKNKEVPYQILMEVTGVYHEKLLYYLYDVEAAVCLEMPKRVKHYLQSIGQYSKTDKLDSKGISRMACERKFTKWKPGSKHIRELRVVLRHRKSLIKSKNQFKNQLHALNHSSLEAEQIKDSLMEMIEKLDQQVKVIEAEALRISKEDKAQHEKAEMIADSIRGLGIISLLTVLSETNGFEDMRSQKQLESYAGFDVVENSSGKHIGKTRISKRGNVHLRTAMYMPVVTMVRLKPRVFYDLYERLVRRNGGLKKKAMVAVQRKLLVMIYTLWKKNEKFDPDYESKKHDKMEKEVVLT